MSVDFCAGYVSGALGIIVGNPFDVKKVQLQAGEKGLLKGRQSIGQNAMKGVAAPVLGYGALNALLFSTYNRTVFWLDPRAKDPLDLSRVTLFNIWIAGAVGGMATWVVSAPTELIKCRVQLGAGGTNSWVTARRIWRQAGVRGLYLGGTISCARDALGYGFYFWTYELCKRCFIGNEKEGVRPLRAILSGGIAGIATWSSIYPLDLIKTRVQGVERLGSKGDNGAFRMARDTYYSGGLRAFFRGLGACNARAFIVNAVQWSVYEWMMGAI